MKKLAFLFMFVGVVALAAGLNFYGHQSIVNLGRTNLFTAPGNGSYYIQGYLSLPQLSNGASAPSEAVVQVSKNSATLIYQGIPGASGFAIPAVSLVTPDSIAVSVTSNASVDQGLNKIKGEVFFGSAF